MTKLIILEGVDCVGKDSTIRLLTSEARNYIVRHFSSPPGKNNEQRTYNQQKSFLKEFTFQHQVRQNRSLPFDFIIWNRSHIGEYVYGPMYRDSQPETWVPELEADFGFADDPDIYLIHLYADAEFVCKNDDGLSFTTDVEKKRQEIAAFMKAVEESTIKNKIHIQINYGDNYYDQQRILAAVRSFINF